MAENNDNVIDGILRLEPRLLTASLKPIQKQLENVVKSVNSGDRFSKNITAFYEKQVVKLLKTLNSEKFLAGLTADQTALVDAVRNSLQNSAKRVATIGSQLKGTDLDKGQRALLKKYGSTPEASLKDDPQLLAAITQAKSQLRNRVKLLDRLNRALDGFGDDLTRLGLEDFSGTVKGLKDALENDKNLLSQLAKDTNEVRNSRKKADDLRKEQDKKEEQARREKIESEKKVAKANEALAKLTRDSARREAVVGSRFDRTVRVGSDTSLPQEARDRLSATERGKAISSINSYLSAQQRVIDKEEEIAKLTGEKLKNDRGSVKQLEESRKLLSALQAEQDRYNQALAVGLATKAASSAEDKKQRDLAKEVNQEIARIKQQRKIATAQEVASATTGQPDKFTGEGLDSVAYGQVRKGIIAQQEQAIRQLAELRVAAQNAGEGQNKFQKEISETEEQLRGLSTTLDAVDRSYKASTGTADAFIRAAKRRKEALESQIDAQKRAAQAVKAFNSISDTAGRREISSVYSDAITSVKRLITAQKGVLKTEGLTVEQRERHLSLLERAVVQESRLKELNRARLVAADREEELNRQRVNASREEAANRREINRLNKESARQSEIDQANEIRSRFPGGIDAKQLSAPDFSAVVKGMVAEINALRNQLSALEVQSRQTAGGQDQLQSEILQTRDALRKKETALRSLRNEYAAAHGALGQFARLFRQFFRYALGYGALYQVLAGVRALIDGVVDLDDELRSTQAITASTDAQMSSLANTIKRVAITTKFTTKEISKAAKTLGQAGVEAQELPKALTAAADFAAGTSSSLDVAADLLTTMRNVFKEIEDNTIADQLTKAVNISKLTAEDLKSILSLSAQIANSYNLTSEQYLSAVTVLRNAGLKASTVATGLRQGLIEIFNPDSKTLQALQDRYDQIGEQINGAQIRARFFGFTQESNPIVAALTELKRLGFAGEAQKQFQRAIDVRAANAITALIKNMDELVAAEKQLTFGRSAAEAAETQMRSLRNSLKNLGAAMTVFADNVLGPWVGGFERGADNITNMVNSLTDLDNKLKTMGQSGILGILGDAVVGGAAGAVLTQGGIKAKAVGGVGGAAIGAATSYGSQAAGLADEPGAQLFETITAIAGVVIGDRVLRSIGNKAKIIKDGLLGIPKQLDLPGVKQAGSLLSKGGLKTAFVGLGKTLGRFFLGPVGIFLTIVQGAVFIKDLINGYYTKESKDLRKVKAALDSAEKSLETTKSEFDRLTSIVNEYDVANGKSEASKGKLAETLYDLQEDLADIDKNVARFFGEDLPDELRQEIEKNLKLYTDLPIKFRERFLRSNNVLNKLLDGRTFQEADQQITQYGVAITELPKTTETLLKDLNNKVIKAVETVRRARENSVEISGDLDDIAKLQDKELQDAQLLLRALDKTGLAQSGFLQNYAELSNELRVEGLAAISNSLQEDAKYILNKYVAPQKASKEADVAGARIAAVLKDTRTDINLRVTELLADAASQGEGVLQSYIDSLRIQIAGISEKFESQFNGRNSTRRRRRKSAELIEAETSDASELLSRLEDANSQQIEQANKVAESQLSDQTQIYTQILLEYKEADGKFKKFLEREAAENGKVAAVLNRVKELENLDGDALAKAISDGLVTVDAAGKKAVKVAGVWKDIKETSDKFLSEDTGADAYLRALEAFRSASSEALKAEEDSLRGTIEHLGRGRDKSDLTDLVTSRSGLFDELRNITRRRLEAERAALENQLKELDKEKSKDKVEERVRVENQIKGKNTELSNLDREIDEFQADFVEKYKNNIREMQNQLADANEKLAQRMLDAALNTTDSDAFDLALAELDKVNAQKLELYIEDLKAKGILPTGDTKELFDASVSAVADTFEEIHNNAPRFIEATARMTDALLAEADRIANKPITTGDVEADARSQRYGRVGDERRRQELENQANSADLTVDARSTEFERLSANLESSRRKLEQYGEVSGITEAEVAELTRRVEESADELTRAQLAAEAARQELEAFGEDAGTQFFRGFSLDLFIEGLEDSRSAVGDLSKVISDELVASVDNIGDAFADSVLEGKNFGEAVKQELINLASEIYRISIKRTLKDFIINLGGGGRGENSTPPFFPEGGDGVISEAGAIAGGDGTISESGATAEGGGILSQAGNLLKGAAGFLQQGAMGMLQSAAQWLFGSTVQQTTMTTAATALTGAAAALTGAAAALSSSAAVGSLSGGGLEASSGLLEFGQLFAATGGVFSKGTIKRSKYAGGGILKGPGTSTSDSIPGIAVGRRGIKPIALSDGEGILNVKAVKFLGEDFIHRANAGKFTGFNAGGVIDFAKMNYKPQMPAGRDPSPAAGNLNVTQNIYADRPLTTKTTNQLANETSRKLQIAARHRG